MTIDAFIDALPKVELHVHLIGSASAATVLELSRRHPGSGVPTTEEELHRFYTFRDFPHFAKVYGAVNALVREPQDVATLVLGLARDLALQGARYVELQVTPYAHHIVGMPMREVTEALDLAARRSAAEYGVETAYIFDIPGEYGEEAARITVEHALQEPPAALVGFGIGGIEQERRKYRDAYRSAFSAARAAGLHSVPHGGEMTGPETIWEVIEGYGAERVGHGITCLSDPRLVAHLRETQLPLDVCPTSNLCTGQVARLEDHPLPRMLEEGLYVTLNSDDPPMFATTLAGEYRLAAKAFGLGARELAQLARNGVQASYLAEGRKQALVAEIDALVAAG
ncbi:adenosine deaminase [Nonomuraea sp. KC401]|uniref:adenosine deaminase n=1 Tax=unclassified Nonomuraea TaxID=2593643 RepID=UPI0010FD6893|nr:MULTISPECIES: adenosine deaminase [unclassified Nonomuraea]NBE98654.1 adenosine deaminase [Nonomuraea sp. K271]TLF60098.1 adenosine deaminase [Nonomuraea sp. KC401]